MLLHGDCLDLLPTLEAGSIDLTVTSPPYDNLRTYNGSLNDWTQPKWEKVIAELFRVTKPGGVVVWVVGDATVNGSETGTSFRQALHAKTCGFLLHDTMIYATDKPPCAGPRYQPQFEFMFVWSKGRPKSVNLLREPCKKHGSNDFRMRRFRQASGGLAPVHSKDGVLPDKPRGNIWRIASGHNCSTLDKEAFKHPAIFPEALARDHILSWSNAGDTVLDPFTGSGTTGKMALLHGRKFIGIERDADYFAIAQRRIDEARNATPLLMAAE